MSDQNPQQSLQPSNAYPSPHSYPSPSMQPTYTYPPPQGQSNQEPYRGSPQGSSVPLPPLNLPPIRLQDGQVQQSSQQPPIPQPMASPHPPQHHMPQYYHPGPPQPVGMGVSPHLGMRYALPPQGDQRILSGGRNKKEVKRRTKTGCLTCRKRRIKCDEAHPVCRNCQKSKRECAGYDPIFKQQPGPAQIQPAPNSTPHQTPVPVSSPPISSSYSAQVPHGYAPAVSAGYMPPTPSSGPSHQPHESFSNPAIDPALASESASVPQGGPPAYNGAHALNPILRDVGSSSPFPTPAHPPRAVKGERLKITDLFPIGGHPPPDVPPRQGPIPQELDDEFATMFARDYCQGLDAILETNWYSTNNNALKRILADKNLHEEAIFFVETCHYRRSPDMSGVFSQEARLIWHMLSVCKHAPPPTNGTNGAGPAVPEDEDTSLKEVRARFDILEALLTNEVLPSNPLYPPQPGPEPPAYRRPEIDFWRELGHFVVHDNNDSPPPTAADYALSMMRSLLGQETRDALYSIAIARRLGNRIGGFPNSVPAPPPNLDPENDLSKLTVAMGHISYECRNGTQQVIARICDMALLSWTASRKSV